MRDTINPQGDMRRDLVIVERKLGIIQDAAGHMASCLRALAAASAGEWEEACTIQEPEGDTRERQMAWWVGQSRNMVATVKHARHQILRRLGVAE